MRTITPDQAAPEPEPAPAPAVPVPVHTRTAALVLLVLLALIWGAHWAVVKIGLQTMAPLSYATVRIAVGLGTAVGVVAFQRRLRRPARSDVPVILSVGIAQIALSVIVQNIALQVVAAGRSSVLFYTMPLWVAAELALFFRIRPSRADVLGIALGIGGLVVLFNPIVVDWGRPGQLPGIALMLGYAVVWAGVTIQVRRHHWTSTPAELQPWQLLVAFLFVAVFALWREGVGGIVWNLQTMLILLYSGVLATAFAFWASQAVTRALGAQASATGFLAVPVVGLLTGALWLGEPLTLVDVLGMALVIAGVALASLLPRRSAAGG